MFLIFSLKIQISYAHLICNFPRIIESLLDQQLRTKVVGKRRTLIRARRQMVEMPHAWRVSNRFTVIPYFLHPVNLKHIYFTTFVTLYG